MSLALLEIEILRFLKSAEPEVLCIKGTWGVGKTYTWRKYLADAQEENALGYRKYSYVSLFGLNSLEDLRFSIFESTVTGGHVISGPNADTFEALIAKGTDLGRKMRLAVDAGLAFFNRKGVADVLYKTAFLAVRKQLVCLDDLERAGSGLNTRDVLGLASFLKEDRKCKVVLLLNDERMDPDSRAEFDRQLEKVADTTLAFDLSPEEATKIALTVDSPIISRVQPRIVELRITNIRVIKKIERLANRLAALLEGFGDRVIDQAITSLVLAGWSVLQADVAPPLDFIRSYNRISVSMRAGREEVDDETKKWRDAIKDYPYTVADDFDLVILDGAAAGYFDEARLRAAATLKEAENLSISQDSAFSKAWEDLYHGSLATEDDEFLDALHRGAISDATAISLLNINSAVRLLRECGRGDQADEVIERYITAHDERGVEFFNIENHHFSHGDAIDENLRQAFSDHRQAFVDPRDPLDVLRLMGERGG